MPTTWGPPVPIRTDRLILRPHTPDDLDDLVVFHSDPDVVRWLTWPVRDREQTRVALEEKIRRGRPDDSESWVVLAIEVADPDAPDVGHVVGEVLLKRDPAEHRLGELGYALSRAAWGRGIAGEAARALLDVAFRDLGMHRVEAICNIENTGSSGLMRRLGMRHEARHLESGWFKGEWASIDIYAILSHEWLTAGTS